MPARNCKWTPERERMAAELFRYGVCAEAIAAEIGMGPSSVYKKLKELRLLCNSPRTDEWVKELIDTFDSEPSGNTAVAKKMGVTRNVIIGQRHRNGFGPGREIVVGLARKYPHATALEIAEATGRDRAPQILILNNEPREQGSLIRRELVARMRAELAREPV